MLQKIKNHWLLTPPVKFYSDYTPVQKAWWGMWKRPQDLISYENVLKLNEKTIKEIQNIK